MGKKKQPKFVPGRNGLAKRSDKLRDVGRTSNGKKAPVTVRQANETELIILAAKTPAGGWSKAQLAAWGVPWPPPKGWKERLIADDALASSRDAAQREA